MTTQLQTVEDVLIAHQRMDSRTCLCGFDKLGASHSAHVAKLVIDALHDRIELFVIAHDEGSHWCKGECDQCMAIKDTNRHLIAAFLGEEAQ